MATESTNDHPEPKFVDSETALGGADAVEKTTYVVGDGTDPEALSPRDRPPSVGRSGMTLVGWIAIAIALLIGIAYAIGIVQR
ncbi:MAG: hypothetical protein ABI311_11145 [Gemmatimonadaceae bacterium]